MSKITRFRRKVKGLKTVCAGRLDLLWRTGGWLAGWVGGWPRSDNKANSVQLLLQWPTGTELGNIPPAEAKVEVVYDALQD